MTNPESPDYAALIEELARLEQAGLRDGAVLNAAHLTLLLEPTVFALRALLKERDDLAIKLGATEEAFTDYRGQVAGEVCGLCNLRERAACYASREALQSKLEQYDKALEDALFGMNGPYTRHMERELKRIRKL